MSSRFCTVFDLASRVFTYTCELCHNHGEILHLLKMKRVCFNCVSTDRRLLAVPPTFANNIMGLSIDEIKTLPHLWVKPQGSFWGARKGIYPIKHAVDYTAAIALATRRLDEGRGWKTPTFAEPQSHLRPQITRTKRPVPENMRKRKQSDKVPAPLYKRRKMAPNIDPLPSTIIHPPESLQLQHACCVPLFPLRKTTDGVRQIPAFHCAGCSFFWNYHSQLPYQCHGLYQDDVSTARKDGKGVAQTPCNRHIETCLYAQVYWNKLYPKAFDHTNPSNPHLVVNGGKQTPDGLARHQLAHTKMLLDEKSQRFIHFPRHPELFGIFNGRGLEENNRCFEQIPLKLLRRAQQASSISRKTGLELELAQKLHDGDPAIRAMLSSKVDWTLSPEERTQIDWVRERERNRCAAEGSEGDDLYADGLLGNTTVISQAAWATARTGSATHLFGAWYSSLMDRNRRMAESEARDIGDNHVNQRMKGWGLDRFGCVSRQC